MKQSSSRALKLSAAAQGQQRTEVGARGLRRFQVPAGPGIRGRQQLREKNIQNPPVKQMRVAQGSPPTTIASSTGAIDTTDINCITIDMNIN